MYLRSSVQITKCPSLTYVEKNQIYVHHLFYHTVNYYQEALAIMRNLKKLKILEKTFNQIEREQKTVFNIY